MQPLGYATRLLAWPGRAVRAARAESPSADEPRGVDETRVILQRRWRNLTAQVHCEPDRIAPTMIASTPQTKFVMLLAGELDLHVRKIERPRRMHFRTKPGYLSLSPPHRPEYELEYCNVAAEPMRSIHVYLHDDLLTQTAEADADLDAARLELPEDHLLNDPLLIQLNFALAHDLGRPEAQSELYADTAARMLAVQLVRRHGTVRALELKSREGALSSQRLRRLNDYVREHLKDSITLDELAAVVSLSPYHFCRAFRRATGQSPNEYVIAQRMARAAHLLRRRGLTVAHVASEVGYRSVSHFSQLFERHTGCAPATFAQRRLS